MNIHPPNQRSSYVPESESRIVPCKNLANLQKCFVFFSFYKLVSQVKIHLVYKNDIVDFIYVIILA